MLPPFIIEQIRKREEDERTIEERPVLEIPVPPAPPRAEQVVDDGQRGLVVIDLFN
ncbi:MAG: hypothetical protein KF901_17030 [Myxococcales bacterium]|nr:hypothetical protein [Myxococcales bacterium]